MDRKHFRRIGNEMGFYGPNTEMIFEVIQEFEGGYLYILKTTPYGPLNFVRKSMVQDDTPPKEVKKN